jgi:hypothetical protein
VSSRVEVLRTDARVGRACGARERVARQMHADALVQQYGKWVAEAVGSVRRCQESVKGSVEDVS